MPYSAIKFLFTNCPSSAQVARTYADNVNRPLSHRLTPPRLTYYAYLLVLSTRLILNSFFREVYNSYDLAMLLFDHYATHHMAGLVLASVLALGLAFDYLFGVRAHHRVAPMLLDLLKCDGKENLPAKKQKKPIFKIFFRHDSF